MSELKTLMDLPEFNDPNFDPSKFVQVGSKLLHPGVAFAPMDEFSELIEMQPQGLSLADAWMIRAAGLTKEQLNSIMDHGFTLTKGPPGERFNTGLLTDHDLQLLEETEFDVQPMRKLMSLGYSVRFIEEPADEVEKAKNPTTNPNEEMDKLDQLGFDIQPLKVLLDRGFSLVRGKGTIDNSLLLSTELTSRLESDGFTLTSTSSDSPPYYPSGVSQSNIGPPSSDAQIKSPSGVVDDTSRTSRPDAATESGTLPDTRSKTNVETKPATRNLVRSNAEAYNLAPPRLSSSEGGDLSYSYRPIGYQAQNSVSN